MNTKKLNALIEEIITETNNDDICWTSLIEPHPKEAWYGTAQGITFNLEIVNAQLLLLRPPSGCTLICSKCGEKDSNLMVSLTMLQCWKLSRAIKKQKERNKEQRIKELTERIVNENHLTI